MLWRYLPLMGIVSLILIGGVVRPLLQLYRHGSGGVFLFRGDSVQSVRDTLLVLLFAAFIAHGFWGPKNHIWTSLLVGGDSEVYLVLRTAGAVLILAGIIISATAQLDLGASWRIGIDQGTAPGVVTSGLYRISRHPIFLGFLMVFAGFAAMQPTLLSVLLVLGAWFALRAQAKAEEEHMLRTYGEAYRCYAGRVGRFIPGLGRRGRTAGATEPFRP